MVRERGSGATPPRLVKLLADAVNAESQLAISKATGVGIAAINRYLKGVGEPTTATLQKFADYFGLPVEWLRGEDRVQILFPWLYAVENDQNSAVMAARLTHAIIAITTEYIKLPKESKVLRFACKIAALKIRDQIIILMKQYLSGNELEEAISYLEDLVKVFDQEDTVPSGPIAGDA